MKRYIILILCVLSLLVACDRNESNDTAIQSNTEELLAYNELLSELHQYNSSYGIETRAGGKFWKKLGWIALCDLGGYALPFFLGVPSNALGIFLGVISSMGAFADSVIDTRSNEFNDQFVLGKEELYFDLPISDIHDCDSAGYWHNLIINDIYEMDSVSFYTYSSDQLTSVVETAVLNYFPAFEIPDDAYSKIEDFRELLLTFENQSIEETFHGLIIAYPEFSQELRIIQAYCEAINELDDEKIPDYSTGFRQVVIDSKISDQSKQTIRSTISVAGSSKLLWSDSSAQLDL